MSVTAANVNNFVKQPGQELVTTAVDIPAIILRCEKIVTTFDDRITADDFDNLVLLLAAFFVSKEIGSSSYREYYEMYTDMKKDIRAKLDTETVTVDPDGVDTNGVVTVGKLSRMKDTFYDSSRTLGTRRY